MVFLLATNDVFSNDGIFVVNTEENIVIARSLFMLVLTKRQHLLLITHSNGSEAK